MKHGTSIDVNCEHCGWTKRVKPSRRYIKNWGAYNIDDAYYRKAEEMIMLHVEHVHKETSVSITEHNPYLDEQPYAWGADQRTKDYVLEHGHWSTSPDSPHLAYTDI